MTNDFPENIKKDLSKKNWYFVLRTGNKLLFCSITKPKFAITVEIVFKKEKDAIVIEEWYMKTFDKNRGRDAV